MRTAKWYEVTSCNYLSSFLDLTMYHVAKINDVKAFWQAKVMLLLMFRVLIERMVDEYQPPRYIYILQHIYFATAKCTCTYLSILLVSAGVLVLVLVQYFT